MRLATWNPAAPALRNEIDRFFSDLWHAPACADDAAGGWLPRADVLEDADAHRLVLEIPGFDESQVSVTVEDGLLTVKGETSQEAKSEELTYHRIERRRGSFTRSFRLPRGVDAEAAGAEFHNGLLEIRLPKSEKAKPRSLPITRR